jgi:hypothetical protein
VNLISKQKRKELLNQIKLKNNKRILRINEEKLEIKRLKSFKIELIEKKYKI